MGQVHFSACCSRSTRYHQIFFDQASTGFLVELKLDHLHLMPPHAWRLSLSQKRLRYHRPFGLVWGGIKWKLMSSLILVEVYWQISFLCLDPRLYHISYSYWWFILYFFLATVFGKRGCPDCVDKRLQATPTKGAQDRATTSARCMMTSTQRLGVLHH